MKNLKVKVDQDRVYLNIVFLNHLELFFKSIYLKTRYIKKILGLHFNPVNKRLKQARINFKINYGL